MIASLSGTVTALRPTWLVLSVGGVGYKIYATPSLLSATTSGDDLSVWTHLVVREEALDLYGFTDYGELELFKLLISVSGVGPRGAIGILSLDKLEKLKSAIAASDVGYLTKVSGIGKKTAEKVCLELRDKLGDIEITDAPGQRRDEEDTLEALKALGYRQDEAREALRLVDPALTDQGVRIREALKLLSRQ
jgi:Holliday junction DNA helicase RuvA